MAFLGWVRPERGGARRSLPAALRRVLAFLAERASFLAGGGDMVLAGSVAALLRTGDLGFATFVSSPLGSALEGPAAEGEVP